jgi:hypothetical protein
VRVRVWMDGWTDRDTPPKHVDDALLARGDLLGGLDVVPCVRSSSKNRGFVPRKVHVRT